MEQDTSNNLMVSVEAQQEKITLLEQKREQFIKKLRHRDELISQLEGVIEELTE